MPPNIPEASTRCPGSIPEKNSDSTATRLRTVEYIASEKSSVQDEKHEKVLESKTGGWFDFQAQLIWGNIIGITLLHIGSIWALFTFPMLQYKMLTLWGLLTGLAGGFGVTGGAHRFWTHRTYKANTQLRIILAACYLTAGMNSIFDWVRDHRVHHKFSETDADPHNTHRGFFFSHVGWLMMKKHPEVIRRGKQVDMTDVVEDPVAHFVDTHFTRLKLLLCFVLPTIIPVYCWNENLWMTIVSQVFIRYPFTLNATWSVNSFAHFFGTHEYDKTIRPAENKWVAFTAMGEGWHNYHHAFPWDYKAAELGNYRLNVTTMLIDGFAKIGWATDLKTASEELVQRVTENRGDGGHPRWGKVVVE